MHIHMYTHIEYMNKQIDKFIYINIHIFIRVYKHIDIYTHMYTFPLSPGDFERQAPATPSGADHRHEPTADPTGSEPCYRLRNRETLLRAPRGGSKK